MGTSMGIARDDAAEMATTLVDLAADLASFKNLSIEQAMTALRGVFTGEGESLKTLGIIMQESTLKAFALSSGMKKTYEEMTQAEKVALRYAYVMSVTQNAQGDFARTSDGAANQMRIFQESVKELGASFGEILLPMITPLISGVNDVIIAFGSLPAGTKEAIIGIAAIAAAIGPVLVIGGQVVTLVGSIAGALALMHGSTVIVTPAIAGLATVMKLFTGGTIAATAATTAHTVATTAGTVATKIATVAQGLFNAVMTASPIILVVGGLVALGAALYVVIKHWKEIVGWLKEAWEWLNKWNAIDVKDKAVINNPRLTGYASGTKNALPGWHWVGEEGPELINFKGGEAVMSAGRSAQASAAPSSIYTQGGANQTHQYVLNITLRTEAREIARDVFQFIEERNNLVGHNLLQEG
jgi:phage-related tail protein